MDRQTLSNLIEHSKQGNREAMEQLLIYAHTQVSYQCRRLLNDAQQAENMTGRILNTLALQIDKIESADHFHKWLGNVTAARCMRKRNKTGVPEYMPESLDMAFPSNELSRAQTAQVVGILADALEENSRICLILSVCCAVSTNAIAQMTGFPEAEVTGLIAQAEGEIQEQMQLYQAQGVVFAGSLSIDALLRIAMFQNPQGAAAEAMAKKAMPPVPPAEPAPVLPKKRPDILVIVLLCVVMALLLVIGGMILGILGRQGEQEPQTVTVPTEMATEATETTTQPTTEPETEPTTQPTTEPTVPETTVLETTVPETTVPETTEAVETTEATKPPKTATTKPASKPASKPAATTATQPAEDPDYNPGQGEDGHTHQYFTVPAPGNQTCSKAGQIYRLCSICKKGVMVDDPARPALGHDFQVNIVVAPTTEAQGYTVYTCSRCGKNENRDYLPALTQPEQPSAEENQPPAEENQPSSGESSATQTPPADDHQNVSSGGESASPEA